MKLVNGIVGTPIQPDYEMLRTALVAAQATTRTARAASASAPDALHASGERTAALHDLLAADQTTIPTADADARLLGNSFAPFADSRRNDA